MSNETFPFPDETPELRALLAHTVAPRTDEERATLPSLDEKQPATA